MNLGAETVTCSQIVSPHNEIPFNYSVPHSFHSSSHPNLPSNTHLPHNYSQSFPASSTNAPLYNTFPTFHPKSSLIYPNDNSFFQNHAIPPHMTHNQASFIPSHLQQMQLMSNHLLEQDLIKKSIEIFDGTPTRFWSWVGQLESYIGSLNLSPLKALQLISSYCTGEPQKMISRHLSAVQFVTQADVNEVWENLTYRFGSSQGITKELLHRIHDFKVIKGFDVGEQLLDLHDLSKVILHNIPRCPDLQNLNLASGLEELRRKLPQHIQSEWRKLGQTFEDNNNGYHPPFSVFVEFLKKQARLLSNKNYETLFCSTVTSRQNFTRNLRTMLTDTTDDQNTEYPARANQRKEDIPRDICPLHKSGNHNLSECHSFKKMPYNEK